MYLLDNTGWNLNRKFVLKKNEKNKTYAYLVLYYIYSILLKNMDSLEKCV